MLRYPEAIKKAQEEIDRVIGPDRLPTLEDRDSLPYVDCVIGETIRYVLIHPLHDGYHENQHPRWQPTAPLGTETPNFLWTEAYGILCRNTSPFDGRR